MLHPCRMCNKLSLLPRQSRGAANVGVWRGRFGSRSRTACRTGVRSSMFHLDVGERRLRGR